MRKITLVIAMGVLAAGAHAQTSPSKIEAGRDGLYPSLIEFSRGSEPAFTKGKVMLVTGQGLQASSETILKTEDKDALGFTHYRYQQKINNIPVEDAVYIMHVSNGKVKSQNGDWILQVPADLKKTASIGKEAALNAAMADFGAKVYKWQMPDEELFIKRESNDKKATFFPSAELVYYSGNEISAASLKLAYKLDIYAQEPVGRRIYFVDAVTGRVLGHKELLHNADVVGTAVTAYSGSQSITTDSYNGSYRLREAARGLGIQTFDLKKGTSYAAAVDFTDADNVWNNVNANWDQYATDAHWGAEKTYDYYKNTYGRNSINNAGFAIKSYVHYSTNYFNAFWDGSRMTYGDGGSTDGNKPLTALDVCGHEITHGLTSFTSNLTYSGESGAMNEGFSDIFGTAIEFYARPSKADWLIGADFYTIRSMSNPNTYQQPDTYQGTYWYTGSSDNGGVHTNSGVLNFWFYLLSQGGSGTNDKGTAFNVTGITMAKAAAIAYRTLTTYLTASSNYAAARTASLTAATDLYGAASPEVTQVGNAWNAVGVGGVVVLPCTDSYEANETRTTSKTIAVNTDITAKIGSASDKDWFKFTTTAAAPKVKITLTNLPADYDVKLYNSSGTQLKVSQNAGTTSETITYNTQTTAKTYYIQVYGYASANSPSCYLLKASTSGTNFLGDAGNAGIVSSKPTDEILSTDKLTVYPNPVKNNKLTLSFTEDAAAKKQIAVTDILGRQVFKQSIDAQKGSNNVTVDLPSMAHGIYMLKLDDKRFVKFQVVQ